MITLHLVHYVAACTVDSKVMQYVGKIQTVLDFLPHPSKRRQKKAFNGQQEFLQAPVPMTGEQIYNENVAESIVGTLLHVLGKTKDGLNARLDLAELGVKPELFAMQDEETSFVKRYTTSSKEIILQELDKMQAELVVTLNKPEGCIAEETIAEETIEFFSEYHKSMETIGIPPGKHETYENEEGKPLSAGTFVCNTEYR
ncbi:hypothetical protein Tco_1488540 [Tanacetum coccineum]